MKKLMLATLVYTLSTFGCAGEWYTNPDGLKMWNWDPDNWTVEILENQNDEPGYLNGKAKIKWINKKTGKSFEGAYFFSSGMSTYEEQSSYYVNDSPPSDDDLKYSYVGYGSDGGFTGKNYSNDNFIMKIHGRAETHDNGHSQIAYATIGFYKYKKDGEEEYTPVRTELIPIILIKLDSNMWIMQYHAKQLIVKKAMK